MAGAPPITEILMITFKFLFLSATKILYWWLFGKNVVKIWKTLVNLIMIQNLMYLQWLWISDNRNNGETRLEKKKNRRITKFCIRQANVEICPSFRKLLYIIQVSCPHHTAKTIIIWISLTGTILQALIFAFLFGGRIWPVLGKGWHLHHL